MIKSKVPSIRLGFGILAVLLVCGMASPASAGWLQGGIEWRAWPSGSNVGDCFGNCGAGCTSDYNICGGPQQYWDLTFISGPTYTGLSGWDYECDSEYGNMWTRPWNQYQATGTWTYHGWVAPGCVVHDGRCNQFLVGCLLFFGCGGPGWNNTWSYSESMIGYAFGGWEYFGSC